VRRETGNQCSVQVRYDEKLAIRMDPDPSAVACEGDSEASAEEHIRLLLSPAKIPSAVSIARRNAIQTGAQARTPGKPGVVDEPGIGIQQRFCGGEYSQNQQS
jgi:hypothetical protein